MPCNRDSVRMLLQRINQDYPYIEVWLYTGYTYENLDEECKYICNNLCDVIVDGPYIECERDISLPFRGSKNQRIIRIRDRLYGENS